MLANDHTIKSAQIVTAIRAMGCADQINPNPDNLATFFLERRNQVLIKIASRFLTTVKWGMERRYPGLYWFLLLRTRHIDSVLQEALNSHLEQLVVLGAGFDSRAYRFREQLLQVAVFEVDLPSIQAVKKEKLSGLFGALPQHVTFVPINFNEESLGDVLIKSGFDSSKKTLFIWEGVTYYLPASSIESTLDFVRSSAPSGSAIIFDYALKSFIDGSRITYGADAVAEAFERVGEPAFFGIEDNKTEKFLNDQGFNLISDLGPADLECNYIQGDFKQHHMFGCMRLAVAEVKP